MLVGICDFPGDYAFPPYGYGGIERWLWAVAVGARGAGADVHLLGPGWRADLADRWTVRPHRLETLDPRSRVAAQLRADGFDLVVAGHEYLSVPRWRAVADTLDCDLVTFQHDAHFVHRAAAFDAVGSRLYCYSAEMAGRYAAHRPIRELSVQLGRSESDIAARPGRDLVWIGRIDRVKAPHLAVAAAARLGRRIRLIGPVFDATYARQHAATLGADHVELLGELGGPAKAAALAEAAACVYTCSRDYVEAGVATIGESLRAGTPVAALAWRGGGCPHAALCAHTGAIAQVDPHADDDHAVARLVEAVAEAVVLDRATVAAVGRARFDPVRHFHALATRP